VSEQTERSPEQEENAEYERYLIETNRFVKSRPQLYRVRTFEDFEVILKSGNKELVARFFIRRLTEKLNEFCVNDLFETIEKAFHIFMKFYDEERGMLDHYDLLKYLPVMIEAQIITIIKFLEPKIFWKRRSLEEMNGALALIKKSLKWKGYNYEYLLDIYSPRIREHEQIRLNTAKTEISKILNGTQSDK
ncbi:hypothetical protein THOM_0872, partial [Trachipleistophora hominis]